VCVHKEDDEGGGLLRQEEEAVWGPTSPSLEAEEFTFGVVFLVGLCCCDDPWMLPRFQR
jgi:hypothetical protein